MSGPVFKPFNFQPIQDSIMRIDRPHEPFGQHVDLITPFGGGADKMRIGPTGEILSHEMILKGGHKISI